MTTLQRGLKQWCRDNGLPSYRNRKFVNYKNDSGVHIDKPSRTISTSLPSPRYQLRSLIGSIFHCEEKQASSLRIFCPRLYAQAFTKTFTDKDVFSLLTDSKENILAAMIDSLKSQFGKSHPWALGKGHQLPSGYILPKRNTAYLSGRPIISFIDVPFRPMLNILTRLIFQLIPVACPSHFATGDVYTLLETLRSAPIDGALVVYNQDLAGFFTSIDQDRFLGAWHMLLDFLTPRMNVNPSQPGPNLLCLPGPHEQPWRHHQGPHVPQTQCHHWIPAFIKAALICRLFALVLSVFDNFGAVLWAARCHQLCVSWWSQSVNRFGL